MADQTAAPAETETGYSNGDGQGAEAPAPDALLSHMEAMSAKLDQLVPPTPQGPTFGQIADPTFDPYEGFEPAYDPEQSYEPQQGYEPQYQQPEPQQQMDPAAALQWLQNEIAQGVQAQVAPMIAQQRAREIEAQYPDLGKPETIQQIAPVAQQLASSMGLPADGWRNPDFLLTVYQAQQAQAAASQQIAPEDQQFDQGFEGGGAGAPDTGEPNLAERILNAYPHGEAAQFWGA